MSKMQSSLVLGLLACALASPVLAQGPGPGPGGRQMRPEEKKLWDQMEKEMRAHEARLDELVAAMNAAQGPAKVDAIAAVVNELVAERKQMRVHRDQMRELRGAQRKDRMGRMRPGPGAGPPPP